MGPVKSAGNQAASAAQASIAQAAAFYAVATERSIELPVQNWNSGVGLPFNLPPSGIGTWTQISLRGTLSLVSGATIAQPTASPWYPYNLLGINYVDYLGFTRCNASGWQLHLLEQIRSFQFNPANVYGVTPATVGADNTPVISSAAALFQYAASVPVAAVSTTVTAPVAFTIIVPISTSRNTIKGSHLFNITGAQDVLTVNCNPVLGGANTADAPLSGNAADTTATIVGTLDTCYYYLDWPAQAQVPKAELALAHQINSVTQTTNLAAGVLYQYLLPTGFVYSRLITQFVNNGAPDTTDVTQVSFYLDANTPVHTENLVSYLGRTLRMYGQSMPDGVFVTDLSTRPVNSNSYSQVAVNLQISNGATITGATFMRTLSDALTLQNQNLQALGAQG